MTSQEVIVVGGGLAGCEAAWQMLKRGFRVSLYEMKPVKFSPAHKSSHLAELICSNSLRSNAIENAAGLLKEEMRILGSLILEAADLSALPAGKALAVDRFSFSKYIENKLSGQNNFNLIHQELKEIPKEKVVIIATGPLTSDDLAQDISNLTGREYLYFYDAISPIIEEDSINHDRVFRASRYDSREGDYLNCPLTKNEYDFFWKGLTQATEVPLKKFEEPKYFEGCLPIEVMAKRGKDTLRYGPMKPVGLTDHRTGEQPYAVAQLRQDDKNGSCYNMAGFQTKLTWAEQKRVFRMIPGLEQAEFSRYGSIHRNTFINGPALLNKQLQLRNRKNIFFAGQITGVEGYIESAAIGFMAGINAAALLSGKAMFIPPDTTAIGTLIKHIYGANEKDYQPMNTNYSLFPAPDIKVNKRYKKAYHARRALRDLLIWKELFLK
jgi:methylenetetrahydrofolate--tRNA-(uracil-5-)-methyltransferase